MTDVAFRLGQLLAVADLVHRGFCMDERNGQVPPTLLGNSVYAIAQADPARALAVLSRRWKVYGGWQHRADREAAEALTKKENPKPGERERGWAIWKGLSQARRFQPLAQELAGGLPDRTAVDDRFRAELLLGYVAGMPKAEKRPQEGEETE